MQDHVNKKLDIVEYHDASEIVENLKINRVFIKIEKKKVEKNAGRIDELTTEINLLKKYRNRIGLIPEGVLTIGQSISTQRKRNAYKIDPSGIPKAICLSIIQNYTVCLNFLLTKTA